MCKLIKITFKDNNQKEQSFEFYKFKLNNSKNYILYICSSKETLTKIYRRLHNCSWNTANTKSFLLMEINRCFLEEKINVLIATKHRTEEKITEVDFYSCNSTDINGYNVIDLVRTNNDWILVKNEFIENVSIEQSNYQSKTKIIIEDDSFGSDEDNTH